MRASRLLSILILMQLKGRVTAEALASEFEVSVRTIYRDVDALSAAGVPVYGDKGPGGGFQLRDGYRTRLTGLDDDEAAAILLAGLQRPSSDLGLGDAASRARNKLLASLSGSGAARARLLGERIHLDTSDWYQWAATPSALPLLAQAVFESRCVSFTYESWSQTRAWTAEPLGLVLKSGRWYLVASSGAKRLTFTVGRISNLSATDRTVVRPAGFDLARWWQQSLERFEKSLRPATATIRVAPDGLDRIAALGSFASHAVADAGPPDRRGWRSIKLPIETGDHSALALLGCGPNFRIVEPVSFRRHVAKLAAAIAAQNR